MKKIIQLISTITLIVTSEAKSQVQIGTTTLVATENINTHFCYNNSKLMLGDSISNRYIVYYNSDTIFLNVNQSGSWTKRIAYIGTNIALATLALHRDTVWVCWKENTNIKTSYTANKGISWDTVMNVSPAGNVSAPSISAASNGKIHFVWHTESVTDTTVFHTVYYNGAFLSIPNSISNPTAQGSWPSIITKGDTVLCAWKEKPSPAKVWFSSSFNGGMSWSTPILTDTVTSTGKDPNLAYAFDPSNNIHYVYLAYDGNNKIYFQRSVDFGVTWSSPAIISNPSKKSQFASIECNNSGFVGVAFEHWFGTNLFDDTKKDVGFVYSTAWAISGTFGNDSLAYTYNGFGSLYVVFNRIDENNFYLTWLTKDTIINKMMVFERHIYLNGITGFENLEQNINSVINIFPNPTNGIVNLNLVNQTLQSIKIYNMTGELMQENFNANFSIINFPDGIYLAIIQTDRGKLISKIIKF